MSSDIYLQSRYDLEVMFKMKVNRNRPLFIGRGRTTKISDIKCSREQVKVSLMVPEKRRIGKKTEPLCLEIQPTHRFLTVHYHEEDSLEEVKKGDTAILQVGDSFSVFGTYFWFTLCAPENLNDLLDQIEKQLEPHLEEKPKPKPKSKSAKSNDKQIKIKLVSPSPTRISERLGKQKVTASKAFDVPPIIITSRENSCSDEDFIDTINDAEPEPTPSFLNAVKSNISNSKKKAVNTKKPQENFEVTKNTKTNKRKYTDSEDDIDEDDSSYGHINSDEDDRIDSPNHSTASVNKRKTTQQTKSKTVKRVRS